MRRWSRARHRSDATPAQIALAWMLQKGDDVVPVLDTKRRKYSENAAAVNITLSAGEVSVLDPALAPEAIAGPRYNENNEVGGSLIADSGMVRAPQKHP